MDRDFIPGSGQAKKVRINGGQRLLIRRVGMKPDLAARHLNGMHCRIDIQPNGIALQTLKGLLAPECSKVPIVNVARACRQELRQR